MRVYLRRARRLDGMYGPALQRLDFMRLDFRVRDFRGLDI
ncbi:hypothetical protein STRTUCAR8_08907 [Streptomyces turgidiscabies Car8]|uniref:Uncharacterized protein n=1 Tax=Streptomyces turgidiscabies (strain Car8) TaxID=698760 RepID=L7FGZ6_STRT8|nr:hypothetical protein STRTUCAR8_08907 [Streptomyces turgidiscabies Car8]